MAEQGDNNDNDGDDKDAFDSFAQALAYELQQNEERQPTNDELRQETYVQLCHDDPQNWTAAGCDLVADALLDARHPYALSERLVEGIQRILQRQEDSSRAVARLAWTVHVRVPFQCLAESKDISKVAALLGSYKGSEVVVKVEKPDASLHPLLAGAEERMMQESSVDEHDDTDGSIEEESSQPQHVASLPMGEASSQQEQGDDFQEVWAAESDPSDFEYGSAEFQQPNLDDWAGSWLDPLEMSRPCHETPDTMAKAVMSLLQTVRYSPHLEGLSPKLDWKESWSEWTQWILTLLLSDQQPTSSLLLQQQQQKWQHVGLHLLHIVRDAAQSHPVLLLQDYLQLIQTLLQVQAAREQDGRSTDAVAPAVWVGLGALAALCQSAITQKHLLPATILESCDDLTLILERSMPSSIDDDDRQKHITLQWTYASLFEVLVGSENNAMSKAHGQTLLQSGLFRQWLLHLSASTPESFPSVLLDLCACSPVLLGKYAWRFPGLAASLCTVESLTESLLWNLMGIHLTEPSRFQLKGAAAAKAPPSLPECQTAAWLAFQKLCQQVESVLEADKANDSSSNSALKEFGLLVERLASLSLLAGIFVTQMAPAADGKSGAAVIQAALHPIRTLLAKEASAIVETVPAEEDEGEDATKKTRRKKSRSASQELRRQVKVLSTILLEDFSSDRRGLQASSFKAD